MRHPYLNSASSFFRLAAKMERAGNYLAAAKFTLKAQQKLAAYHRLTQRDKGLTISNNSAGNKR